ncbi:MAG TPA: universal stress protein [Dehalococcoidia bacterium]|jgi:nucleotide-binding universal stress UspA family protein
MAEALILVPLDGSELAEAALPYAAALAGAYGARLSLLGVVQHEPASGAFGLPPQEWLPVEQAQQRQLRAYLRATAKRLGASLVAGVHTQSGDPVERILRAARRRDVRATVMATHGRGGFKRLILGSVADKVMRLATGPVLLVGSGAGRRQLQLRSLAVPLDGSALAEQALPAATELAQALAVRLLLLRVEPLLLVPFTTGAEYLPYPATLEQEALAAAQAYLDTTQQRLPAGVAAETALLRGAPADTIASYVRERSVDLVVMTTHGRGGLRRLALGSTADRLVRAGLPVLLLRSAVPAPARATHLSTENA